MIKKLSFLIFSLCFMSQAIAAAVVNPPVCPAVDVIKTTFPSANLVERFDDGSYLVGQIDNYNTQNIWGFVIGQIIASNNADALAKAQQALPTLSGSPTPYYFAKDKIYACLYDISYGYIAVAITGFEISKTSNILKMTYKARK